MFSVPSLRAAARDIAPEVKVLSERYAGTGQVVAGSRPGTTPAPLYREAVFVATNVTGGP